MADNHPPVFNGQVGVIMNKDASQTVLKLGSENGAIEIGMPPDLIAVLIDKLEKVGNAAEVQRKKTDPFGGIDGETVVRSAKIVIQCSVGVAEGLEDVAVTFHVAGPPTTYLLQPPQAEDLAQRLLDALRGQGPRPPTAN
ncbi:hypothetical protein BOO69_09715 [Sulfitobacter alexandrii]|uniref:Uncharacterized protein n=1 Tax=Sulfitobacter alexandrii TaxID=1917485 RepID=A0A1J0WH51_9RHOB|nr:hypothetical protein [Sulfitobacter alexandrii]APE43661.1 hypothetical protein BOO69_09715 [Sulfitobacter alexandrii]